MANQLIEALRVNDLSKGKKADNYFDANASVISYSTGFPVMDYYLGYRVNVFNKNGEYQYDYPNLGITAGSYVLFIGKPSTSKTATAVSIAANIVRPFENGAVIHYDLEGAMNYSRIQALTKLPMDKINEGKYILRQEKCSLEDMKASIIRIYNEKTHNPDVYKYNTGKKNEFGEDIIIYEPTVVILDSIATITISLKGEDKKTIEKIEEVSSQTDRMRLTGEIGRFFNEILMYLKEANIILIGINQIKDKPMGMVKSAADILGMKQDESLPGGNTPRFLAHILLRFVAVGSEKYSDEDDGFSGFKVRVEIIKSRVSAALKTFNLIYDKNTGINMVRSTVDYAKELGFVNGNRNGYYFLDNKEDKFTLLNMPEDFKSNPKLYKIMKDCVVPSLETNLSGVKPEELEVPEAEQNFYEL